MGTKDYGKRDPSSHRTPGQIHEMDDGMTGTIIVPDIVKEREMRNQARAMMRRKLGNKAIEGKDIDHKRPVRAKGGGGTNASSNLRVRSRHANRGWDKK